MDAVTPSSLALDVSANPNAATDAVRVVRPDAGQECPVIFASPHSGRHYSAEMQALTCLSLDQLRRSEDAYVDTLIAAAPEFGGHLVCAQFPRVFVDPNRGPWELDPGMFSDRLPDQADPVSRRAASGLGVVPRIGFEGRPLYRRRLRYAEARDRLSRFYEPYHAALANLIGELHARHGFVIVIDMHSMPNQSARGVDFVLGDRFGSSCDTRVVETIETRLRERDYVTVRNIPYAGGYTTEHYGRPADGVHVVQIEINRSLYLDEHRVVMAPDFAGFEAEMRKLVRQLTETDWSRSLSP
ncbi:MAG: N-formylglutamate amidohydrolase [Pseudomonadota bacterium]|nr:N-formylglutamate amidohydrolase [Pseudomonadota bacterium]